MKKLKTLGILAILTAGALFAAPQSNLISNADGSVSIKTVDKDASVKENQKVDGFAGVTVINGKKIKKRNPITFNLSALSNKEVIINFSCDIKLTDTDKTPKDYDLIWMINDADANFPRLSQTKVQADQWTTIKSELLIPLGENKELYLSGAGLSNQTLTYYLKNIDIHVSGEGLGSSEPQLANWADAPSIWEAYKDYFDYFGFACSFNGELNSYEISEAISHQANCITLGNELKPDFLFDWKAIYKTEDFTAEDGKTYQVPSGLPDFNNLYLILKVAKMCGVQVRGHVLVWHQQTPEWFFHQNFDPNAAYVDKATMTARQEWYIKTVLEYVKNWEDKNNKGKRLITTWDVVNEACADNATETNYLRTDSNWFKIYGDNTFIVNAFRYANKYAPADVKLSYNDYNCYQPAKTRAICKVIDAIRAAPDARVDVVGMQSHVSIDYPAVSGGSGSYEAAVKTFLAKNIDVQVTELDIANGSRKYSPIQLKSKYKEYFKLFKKYHKTADTYGINGVTIWGLTDAGTWLDDQPQYKGHKQYPLLFDKDFNCKPAFYGVLEAAE